MKRSLNAMFTVEAAVIVPLITIMVVLILNTCIDLYGGVRDAAQDISDVEQLNTIRLFIADRELRGVAGNVVDTVKSILSK